MSCVQRVGCELTGGCPVAATVVVPTTKAPAGRGRCGAASSTPRGARAGDATPRLRLQASLQQGLLLPHLLLPPLNGQLGLGKLPCVLHSQQPALQGTKTLCQPPNAQPATCMPACAKKKSPHIPAQAHSGCLFQRMRPLEGLPPRAGAAPRLGRAACAAPCLRRYPPLISPSASTAASPHARQAPAGRRHCSSAALVPSCAGGMAFNSGCQQCCP